MNDAARSNDGDERPNCAACDEPLHGMYCHACGQHHGGDKGIEFLTKDVLAEALSLEGRTVTTLRDVFWKPGRLLQSYRLGVGDHYFSPFKLFLLVSAAFFVFVTWVNVPIYQYLPHRTGGPVEVTLIPDGFEMKGVSYEDIYLRPQVERPVIPELEAAFDRALVTATPKQREAIKLYRDYNAAYQAMNEFWNNWLPRFLWLLSPIYAALLYVFFHKRSFAEHAVFTIWAHCAVFMILMAIALINLTGVGMPARVLFPVYLGFFTIAAASFYDIPRWQALLRGLGHTALYAFFIWFPVLLIASLSFSGARVNLWQYILGYEHIADGHERLRIVPDPMKDPPPQTVTAPGPAEESTAETPAEAAETARDAGGGSARPVSPPDGKG